MIFFSQLTAEIIWLYGLANLNKPKLRQVYTNDEIITQNIFNAAVSTSIELKTNTKKEYLYEYLISTRCLLHAFISYITVL